MKLHYVSSREWQPFTYLLIHNSNIRVASADKDVINILSPFKVGLILDDCVRKLAEEENSDYNTHSGLIQFDLNKEPTL